MTIEARRIFRVSASQGFALAVLLAGVTGGTNCASGKSGSPGTGGTTGNGTGTAGTTGTGTGSAGTTGTGSAGTTGTGTGVAGTTGTGTGVAGTTGTGSGTGGTTGTTGIAGTTGTGTGTAGTTGTGAGGAGGAIVKLCATKTTLMNPVLLNFENYNGTTAADMYSTAFGGATAGTGNAYAGPYAYGDGSVTPTLAILAGHPPGNWGVSETVTQTTVWGMGGGFWMGCADASAYKGISFWVRGSATTAVFSFTVDMDSTVLPDATNPAGGGTCPGTSDTCKSASKSNIPLTADWTQVQILWADLTPGMSGTTSVVPNGNNITGLGWTVALQYQLDPAHPDAGTYVPVPGNLTINLDDISFIP